MIDPSNQEFDSWQWFTAWGDIAPVPALVAILDKHFFPKFHQVLFQWLQTTRNYDDILNWFTRWKAAFPDKVVQDPRTKEQFRSAMEMMNRAVSGVLRPQDGFGPQPPPVQQQARERFTAAVPQVQHTFRVS